LSKHHGGRPIQFFGHNAGESLENYRLIGNHITESTSSNAAILIGRSDGPDKCWIKGGGVIELNTIENVSANAIHIKACDSDIDLDNNVIGAPIRIEELKRAAFTNNCLAGPLPTAEGPINGPGVIDSGGNASDFPDCT